MAAAVEQPPPVVEEHPYIAHFRQYKQKSQLDARIESSGTSRYPTLAANVARCLSFAPAHIFDMEKDPNELFSGVFLQWSRFGREFLFSEPTGASRLDCDDMNGEERSFFYAASRMKQLSLHILRIYQALGSQEALRRQYQDLFGAYFETYYPNALSLFEKVFVEEADVRTEFCIAVSCLERLLGDIFFAIAPKGTPCPRILRDLLATPELTSVLPPEVLFVLSVVIGPPIGLNLRNVTWHGFVSSSEFPSCFLALMLALMASIAKLVSDQGIHTQRRAMIDFGILAESSFDFGEGSLLLGSWEENLGSNWDEIGDLLSQSLFLIPTQVETARSCFSLLRLAEAQQNVLMRHRFCVEIIALFEHCVRKIFVAVNSLPSRFFCAAARGYFTTMDMFLEREIKVDSPEFDNAPNKLADELGNSAFQLLFDIFTHPAGMRPRDRISHGEAVVTSVTIALTDRIAAAFLTLCMHYHPKRIMHQEEYINSLPSALQRCYRLCMKDYTSCFHPFSVLQKILVDSWDHLQQVSWTAASFPIRPENPDAEIDETIMYKFQRAECVDFIGKYKATKLDIASFEPQALYRLGRSLHRRASPFTSASEIITLGSLINVARLHSKFSELFCGKIADFVKLMASPKVPTRQQASFSKLRGLLDAFEAGQSAILVGLNAFHLKGRESNLLVPVKSLTKTVTAFEKALSKFNDNEWLPSLEHLEQVLQFLTTILHTITKPPKDSASNV